MKKIEKHTTTKGRLWQVINQEPSALMGNTDPDIVSANQAKLLDLADEIEQECGFAWKVTSFVRNSPSHRMAISMDIAPDISDSSANLYAVTHRSDPVLYKREPLIRALQRVAKRLNETPSDDNCLGIFIEPDHLHLQIYPATEWQPFGSVKVVKWKIAKSDYPDTHERMKLPLNCGH